MAYDDNMSYITRINGIGGEINDLNEVDCKEIENFNKSEYINYTTTGGHDSCFGNNAIIFTSKVNECHQVRLLNKIIYLRYNIENGSNAKRYYSGKCTEDTLILKQESKCRVCQNNTTPFTGESLSVYVECPSSAYNVYVLALLVVMMLVL